MVCTLEARIVVSRAISGTPQKNRGSRYDAVGHIRHDGPRYLTHGIHYPCCKRGFLRNVVWIAERRLQIIER